MEKRVLGKGLSALIPERSETPEPITISDYVAYVKTAKLVANPKQPRTQYDRQKLDELKASIKEKGVLQPILVRENDTGYEVIAGERRLRAARELGLEEVPVFIKKVSNQDAFLLALVENIQREDLNPIEEALAYKRLLDEFQLSQDDVARSVGKDRSTVSNMVRLLKLPQEIIEKVVSGQLTMGHARALLGVESSTEQQNLFTRTLDKSLSVRELESLIRSENPNSPRRQSHRKKENAHDLVFLEEDLQQTLGTKVRIMAQKKRGKIVIEYYSPDDLERIIQVIKN